MRNLAYLGPSKNGFSVLKDDEMKYVLVYICNVMMHYSKLYASKL